MPSYSCFLRIVSCFIQVLTVDIHWHLRIEHQSHRWCLASKSLPICTLQDFLLASGMDTKVKSTQSGLKSWLRLCDHYLVAHNRQLLTDHQKCFPRAQVLHCWHIRSQIRSSLAVIYIWSHNSKGHTLILVKHVRFITPERKVLLLELMYGLKFCAF